MEDQRLKRLDAAMKAAVKVAKATQATPAELYCAIRKVWRKEVLKSMKQIKKRVTIGPATQRLSEQIDSLHVPAPVLRRWQVMADGIYEMWIHGFITEKQKHTLCQKLLRTITRYQRGRT